MNFFIKHRERFRNIGISSTLAVNFFLIAACWTGEDGAWAATFLMVAISFISCLICHFTQGREISSTDRSSCEVKSRLEPEN